MMIKNEIKRQYFRVKHRNDHVRIMSGSNIFSTAQFGGYNSVGHGCTVGGRFGRGTYCADDCFLLCDIGSFCSVGNRVQVVIGTHPADTWVSTHPAFFSDKKQAGFSFAEQTRFSEFRFAESGNYVTIGNDVWIGDDVRILQGVTVGDGAIIGAGALVTKDVEPYAVVGGIPAKKIRMRFDPEQIAFLESFRWWEKDMDWLKEHAGEFADIRTAMERWGGL